MITYTREKFCRVCSPILEDFGQGIKISCQATLNKKYCDFNISDCYVFYKDIVEYYKKLKSFYTRIGDMDYVNKLPDVEKIIKRVCCFYQPTNATNKEIYDDVVVNIELYS